MIVKEDLVKLKNFLFDFGKCSNPEKEQVIK